MIENFAGKNSFLNGAVARFRRVKFIRMARILEQLYVFSHEKRVAAVMDFIWAVVRPNGNNEDVQQVITVLRTSRCPESALINGV